MPGLRAPLRIAPGHGPGLRSRAIELYRKVPRMISADSAPVLRIRSANSVRPAIPQGGGLVYAYAGGQYRRN